MPLTNSERQKRYRERLKTQNPEKHEELRIKHLEKVKKNTKKIAELTEEERNLRRKKWKEANERRTKKINRKEKSQTIDEIQKHKNVTQKLEDPKIKDTKIIQELKAENEELKRKNKNLKRQLYRYKAEIADLKQQIVSQPHLVQITATVDEPEVVTPAKETPMTKTNKFLDEIPSISKEEKEKVKKKLLVLNTLTDSLTEQYKKADTREEKRALKRVALGTTIKKYKVKGKISYSLGLTGKLRMTQSTKITRDKYMREIQRFFNRDDISRPTAGKQECKTKNKEKKQLRYLVDTMQRLHTKYRTEGGRASYATFARYRPFYVISPKIKDRNTCACIKHANIGFKALKLKTLNVLQTSNMNDLIRTITCRECFDCMYSKCPICVNKTPDINSEINGDAPVQWLEWRLRSHVYSVLNKDKIEEKKQQRNIQRKLLMGLFKHLLNNFWKIYINLKPIITI